MGVHSRVQLSQTHTDGTPRNFGKVGHNKRVRKKY